MVKHRMCRLKLRRSLAHCHSGYSPPTSGSARSIAIWPFGYEAARLLMTIPGIGPVGATALAASVTDPHQFRSGRQFAAWLGLTPLQKSSGGKERLGPITQNGDKYLRKLLIVGMTSLVRRAKYTPGKIDPSRWRTKPHGSSGQSWHVAKPIVRATSRHWQHKRFRIQLKRRSASRSCERDAM